MCVIEAESFLDLACRDWSVLGKGKLTLNLVTAGQVLLDNAIVPLDIYLDAAPTVEVPLTQNIAIRTSRPLPPACPSP